MKVVNRADFLKLPESTVYAKGKPWYFNDINVKHDTTTSGNDWWFMDFCWPDTEKGDLESCTNVLEDSLNNGTSFPMINAVCRNGIHDSEDLFLIFEKPDLDRLIAVFQKAKEL
jgi:hypothetical protein